MGELNFDGLVYFVAGAALGWLLFQVSFALWLCWQMVNIRISVPDVREQVLLRWYALRTWWLVRRERR